MRRSAGLPERRSGGGGPAARLDSAIVLLLRRDRRLALAGLIALALLAWAYLLWDSGHMVAMARPGAMPVLAVRHLALGFMMWTIMMVAMMVPSAAPTILMYATMARRTRERGAGPFPGVWVFAAGYVAVWTLFSLAVAVLQVALEHAAMLSPMLVARSRALEGCLLLAAGIWQWLPLKQACLRHCRSPLAFFATRWRPGTLGAFSMGAEHGAFCLGCCWALMLLLFVGGAMNLLWIAGLAGFVLIEKLTPFGPAAGRLAGLALVAAGLWRLVQVLS